ncbi:hypothetical protein JST97_37100 [bacterium]|nr:hypothetical protein [bacterium]
MSIPAELRRPSLTPPLRAYPVKELPIAPGRAESQPETPVARVREPLARPVAREDLQQRLRESQPGARPNASAIGNRGAWGVAAHLLGGPGAGAYQTTSESYQEDGVAYQKTTSTGPKGYNSTTVTYEKDGVSYVETTTSSGGTTTVRVEATSGETTEITTSRTSTVPGDLDDYVDSDVLGGIQADAGQGVGVTQRTESKTEVIDNSQNPPVVTVVQQSTGYSQQLTRVEDLEGGKEVYAPDGGSLEDQTVYLPEGQYDQQNSGLYVSYTVQNLPEPSTVLQSETRITGTGTDGHPISVSNSRTTTTNAQGQSQVTLSTVEKGTIARDQAEQAYLDKMSSNDDPLASHFATAVSPWLDFQSTTVFSQEGGWPVTTSQFGELDRPGQDSISATKVVEGENKYITFQQVSQDGRRVQTETHIPGTTLSSTSDTLYGENGEFTTTNATYAGDTQISSAQSSRELLYADGQPLPKDPPSGFSAEQWAQFIQAHPQGPVYRDQSQGWDLNLEGQKTYSQGDNYSVNGSVVGYSRQSGAAPGPNQDYLQIDGDQPSGELVIDGVKMAIDADGNVSLDGEDVLVATNVLSQGQGALLDLTKALQKSSRLLERFPNLGPGAGALNVVSGAIQSITSNNWSDRLGGLASLGGGASDLLGAFNTIGRVGVLAERVGMAGGALQITQGAIEFFQKNYAEGAADAVSGAASIAAIALVATNPALAAAMGVVALASGLTRMVLDWGDDDSKKQPAYSLDGPEPDWAFA